MTKMAELKDPELTVSHKHTKPQLTKEQLLMKKLAYQKRFPTAKDIKEKLHWDGSEGQIHNNKIPGPVGG